MSNGLSDAEMERLGKLNEELGEVNKELGQVITQIGKTIQAIGKTLIHGKLAEFQGYVWDNKADIERELGDLEAAIELCVQAGDLSRDNINAAKVAKLPKITRYMSHQEINPSLH